MKYIIANWKLNLTVAGALSFVKALKKSQKNQVIVAAPFTFLNELKKIAETKGLKLAGQDVSEFNEGAYTGEISAKLLKDAGCSYCLIGHSERRIYFKETDAQINQKIKNALNYKITPVICIGETAQEKNKGLSKQVLKAQLAGALKGLKNVSIIVAYEPVWAISTFKNMKSASISDIVLAHEYIRSLLPAYTRKFKVIYGGTVKPENKRLILEQKSVDGVLVGGASLKVSSFNDIISNT